MEDQDKDEIFEERKTVIKALRRTLRRPEDFQSLDCILQHCQRLHDCGGKAARRHINCFLDYFVQLLHRNCETQPLEVYKNWYGRNCSENQECTEQSVWLEKDKSYFCMKKTNDGGIFFYEAIATDTSAGWDKGGLLKL